MQVGGLEVERVNIGFYKIDGDRLRVEAPVAERSEHREENGKMVLVKQGAKLRPRSGAPDEPEPRVWRFFRMSEKQVKNVKTGKMETRQFHEILNDRFEGDRDAALEACVAADKG